MFYVGPLPREQPCHNRVGKQYIYLDGDLFPVLGQRGHFKILAPFTLKPVLLSEDDAADDNPESQEMLEEQLVRLLTREVMDLISKWNQAGPLGYSGSLPWSGQEEFPVCSKNFNGQ